jgi:hypothetical protein
LLKHIIAAVTIIIFHQKWEIRENVISIQNKQNWNIKPSKLTARSLSVSDTQLFTLFLIESAIERDAGRSIQQGEKLQMIIACKRRPCQARPGPYNIQASVCIFPHLFFGIVSSDNPSVSQPPFCYFW